MLNFKKIRIDKNLSQKEFAEKIGVSTRALSNYENGNLDITLKKMQEIASILEIGFFELFTLNSISHLQVQEPEDNYEVRSIEEAQRETIKILKTQLAFVNNLLANSFNQQEH